MDVEPGFDYSPYLGGALSPDAARTLAALGLGRACIAMDSSDATFQTAMTWSYLGWLDAYRELRLSDPASVAAAIPDTMQGFTRLAGQRVYARRLWLAVEDTAGDDAAMAQTLASALTQLAGFNLGGYSGDWYEQQFPLTVGVLRQASIPLWWADYDGVAAVAPGYAGKQYAGNVTLAGVQVDLNVWEP